MTPAFPLSDLSTQFIQHMVQSMYEYEYEYEELPPTEFLTRSEEADFYCAYLGAPQGNHPVLNVPPSPGM